MGKHDFSGKTPEVPSTAKGFLVIRLKGTELQVSRHKVSPWGAGIGSSPLVRHRDFRASLSGRL